jgi:hypothetical protein
MIYRGHAARVPLPCERLQLCRIRQLTFDLDQETRRMSFVGTNIGRQVRSSMTQATQFEQGSTSRGVDNNDNGEEETSSTMQISNLSGRR